MIVQTRCKIYQELWVQYTEGISEIFLTDTCVGYDNT